MTHDTSSAIRHAAAELRAGNLVAFPTETVYGLGADAMNEAAVAQVFARKGRPTNHPVIVHLASPEDARLWAANIPEAYWQLAEAFMPGPLTVVLQKQPHVLDAITGGQRTVALRVPAHPIARALLREFGGGVIAPSANRYGRVSPTTAAAVRAEFGDTVFVLDGGPCQVGIESAIVNVSGPAPEVLRPGMITAAEIAAVLGKPVGSGGAHSPAVPGEKRSHYAPNHPVALVTNASGAEATAVIAQRPQPARFLGTLWQRLPSDPHGYAQLLYHALRTADESGAARIEIEQPPTGPQWDAIWNRLQRAVAPREENE